MRYDRRVVTSKKSPLLIIFLVVFIDLVGFGIVIPILPYYAKQFGATATQLGWLMAAYSGMQFFFAPVWGRLSDRIGRRPVLLMTIFGVALSMIALGLSNSLWMLFCARLFAGICGANISTATAYIADVTSPENRAKGMGMIGAAFGLGFIFGPAIGGALSIHGYGVPMFFAAGLSALNLIFAFFKLTEPPLTQSAREKNRSKRFDAKAFAQTMGDHRTRLATVSFFLVTLGITQMEVCFAIFVLARFGLGAREAGWLLAFMGTLMVLIQGGLIGRLSRRFGESRLIATGAVAMALGLIIFAFSGKIALVFFALTLLAIGNGITNPSLSSLASKGASAETRGATMGIYQSAGSLARVIGPVTAGLVYDRFGIHVPFLMAAGVMIFAFGPNFISILLEGQSVGEWLKQAKQIFKKSGLGGLVRTYGWRLVLCFFIYYLVRDVTLYILLPWLAAKGILGW